MLKQLTIDGFTLIDQATIPFRNGFTAITGETGAGKSVLLKALRLVCGDKAQGSMVRTGKDKAVIEAAFDISKEELVKKILAELEIDFDDELIIRREILNTGKSRARVGGSVVNQSDLQRLGDSLIQMHGQSEQLLLRDIRTHTQMLDDFAGNKELLNAYSTLWNQWNQIQNKISETKKRAQDLAAQKDFLKFQYEELSKANLKIGEEEALEDKVNSASKQEAEQHLLEEIQRILSGENGLLDQVQILNSKIRSLAHKVPSYEEYENSFAEVFEPFESVCKDLSRLQPSISMSEAEIDKANSRIAQIQKLKRKYRTDVKGLMELTAKRCEELSAIENVDSNLEELNWEYEKISKELNAVALELSQKRKAAAQNYDKAVSNILNTLGMPKAEFKTSIEQSNLCPTGMDRIEFMLAPNPGEGFKSLQKAVSGGELSRVLLSIKSVMANLDTVPLLIFDEVDSGISGEVGNSIGDALCKLGSHHQVLTITHLHQVASRAQNQLAVSKKEVEGRTYTTVKELDKEGRITELTRMLGGDSQTVREHAKQLLEDNL